MAKKADLWGIEWPKALLKNSAHWSQNVDVVKLLASMGTITKWVRGIDGKDSYTCMPSTYEINGVQVRFLPHWGYIEIASCYLDVPKSKEDLLKAISAVQTLLPLGLAMQRND